MELDLRKMQRMNEGKREALEIAEEARESAWAHPSFVSGLFLGRVRANLILPYPEQPEADRRVGDAYLARVEVFLRERVDPDAIDRTGEMPPEVIQGLAALGCFGMKISKEYGGLGLSQVNYNRVIALIASYCGSTAVWLSAHQSIGAPQPLKLCGSEEQKHRFLPRIARGAVSAFALTEPDVGSDPAKMKTTAVPTPDGRAYCLNGEKLWCTNGPVAEIMVVMARTPSKQVHGREKKQITAFIVERSMPGVEVVHRCQFMGLRGMQNGLLRFTNVTVPKENLLWGEGQGLKLALMTLNTGRLTLPAACVGMTKRCLAISRRWAGERVQWGAPIGQHEINAAKLAAMASDLFAMEAVTWLTSNLVDRGGADVRLEAAMAKLFCSEHSWRIVDDMVQIRGGRGYETADSLRARGEPAVPAERILRDARINLIIEGTSEIMRLFIAREAVDPHLRLTAAAMDSRLAIGKRLGGLFTPLGFYAAWYPRQWLTGWPVSIPVHLPRPLAAHWRFVDGASHRLARTLFHAMARHQRGLERRQQLLFRFVDIGMDLFAMAATCAYAHRLMARQDHPDDTLELAEAFCRRARARINGSFTALRQNDDRRQAQLGRRIVRGELAWLEEGIVADRASEEPG